MTGWTGFFIHKSCFALQVRCQEWSTNHGITSLFSVLLRFNMVPVKLHYIKTSEDPCWWELCSGSKLPNIFFKQHHPLYSARRIIHITIDQIYPELQYLGLCRIHSLLPPKWKPIKIWATSFEFMPIHYIGPNTLPYIFFSSCVATLSASQYRSP